GFMTYGGIRHQQGKWDFGGYVYLESDMKNQPLQQNLNEEQVEILKQAGNDPAKMVAPSAGNGCFLPKRLHLNSSTEVTEFFYHLFLCFYPVSKWFDYGNDSMFSASLPCFAIVENSMKQAELAGFGASG